MQRIFLTGLAGAGKSTIGRQVARLLRWNFVDTDELLAERSGLLVGETLTTYGEQKFRQLESEVLMEVAKQTEVVIATGGGCILAEVNRTCLREQGLHVYLQVQCETAWQRIQEQLRECGNAALRPLLAGDDGQQRLLSLYEARKQWYEQAAIQISTDEKTPESLARELVTMAIASGCQPSTPLRQEMVTFQSTVTVTSKAIIARGGLYSLPHMLHALNFSRRIFIVTDTEVGRLYGGSVSSLLTREGFAPHIFTIPAGEASKSFQCWQQILDWLVEHIVEQGEPLLALGGGVVGDLSGFAASCYHRGIPLIQVPTSLLAQVDAAVGGKTGINHLQGKNLVGAYYQPQCILVDPDVLLTLPERVYREGWAEIIKYGMALDAELFALIESNPASLLMRDGALLTRIITRCIQLKMDVVGRDERDGGLRNILNYGHTFGHALESLTHYTTWLHGEAVAVGMEVAARIAVARGLLGHEALARQHQLLCAFGLPTRVAGLDAATFLRAMQRDKKVRNGRMRWVLPTQIGYATIFDDIPVKMVQEAVEAISQITDER
jgi:3-dehydroquinate synthase